MRRLEIGGVPNPVQGYEQISEGWGERPLPFPAETFVEVYSSHVIEHLPWFQTRAAIGECLRVLKHGGVLELHTVNFRYLVECYLAGKTGDHWTARGANPSMHPMRWVASRIFSIGKSAADPNWHRAVFDGPYLRELLTEAGFVGLEDVRKPKGPSHGPISIGIRGTKR